ncbi:hypothetical protein TNCV_2171521 [Trichonephila clavipes]|nr:hypothetical protein TNCV_2171521 [Trichonephila clavipes]
MVKVKDSWLPCHEIEPSTDKDPLCRGKPVQVKSVEVQMSSRWCGGEVKRGGTSSSVFLVTWPWLRIMRAAKIIIGAVLSTNNEKAEQECGLPPLESRRKLATIKFTNKLRSYGHEDSPRQDKILSSMQTLPRSSTVAQSHFGMPNRRNKVTKNGNGPSEGLFAGAPVQP